MIHDTQYIPCIMLLIHHSVGCFTVYFFFSDNAFVDFSVFSYNQLNVKPKCSLEASESWKSVQTQPGLRWLSLCWCMSFPMVSSSSFSLLRLWFLLALTHSFCWALWHPWVELSPLTGVHMKSALSILEPWWRVTLQSANFHLLDCPIPLSLLLSSISENLLLHFLHSKSSARPRPARVLLSIPSIHQKIFFSNKYGAFPEKLGEKFSSSHLYELMSFVIRMSYSMFPLFGRVVIT